MVVVVITVVTMMAVMVGAVGGYSNIDTVAGAEVMNTIKVGDTYARDGVRFIRRRRDTARGDAEVSHDNDHSRYHSLSRSNFSMHRREEIKIVITSRSDQERCTIGGLETHRQLRDRVIHDIKRIIP